MKRFVIKYRNREEFIDDLNNPSSNFCIKEYIKVKDQKKKKMTQSNKITLKQLFDKIDSMDKSINNRIDGLEVRIDNVEKSNNERFDRLENRLDYIVKVNKLKDINK